MLRSIQIVFPDKIKHTVVCAHWRNFPPEGASLEESPEDLRSSGEITEAQYARVKIWQKMCGVLWMHRRKCPQCPHMRFLEEHDQNYYLVTKDGKIRTPLIDLPTLENWSRRKVSQGGRSRHQPKRQS